MKIYAVILFALCLVIASCGPKEHELTVMTFNVRFDNPADGENRWEARIPIVKSYMKEAAPDIVGMQEVLVNQIEDFLDIMPGYAYVGTGRDDGRTGGEYSPIYYREERFNLRDHGQFWLSETPEIPGSRSWDAAITRIVSWAALEDRQSGEIIYAFNTHFDHRGVQARLNSIELMADRITEIAGDAPVIVVGDFNIRKSSEDYEFMVNTFAERNGLTNAELIAEEPVTGAQSTFNGFRTDIEPRVIDFIFVDDNYRVLSYRVDEEMENGIFISDHWPVVAEVSYR
ncbi:MAG: endonuclease/exonuclease/phosphatase family protein [Marinilabiliales bacterium]|nr:MAG: endonuclease/exonuclease/phosphatase family protein [Marinilabiliales bacterium]